jgi:molybdopterin-binding protein
LNILRATITKIQNIQNLHLVEFKYFDTTLTMMSLELDSNIKVGTKVELIVKSTQIAFSLTNNTHLSCSNKIISTIKNIEFGELLTSIIFNVQKTTLESIITTKMAKRINIEKDSKAFLFIKASDLSILRVVND